MNNQTFSNLEFRPLLKKVCHSVHIDLRNTIAEKIPFEFVDITRLLLHRKVPNIHF